MNGLLLWTTSAILGAAAVLMTSLGLLAALLFLLAACPLVVRGRPLPAVSGLLSGFGGCWLLFLSRQASTGGALDNAAWWVGVGAVPLVIGLSIASAIVVRALTGRRVASR
jgi:hypothetical protein